MGIFEQFHNTASGCPRRQLYWCPQKWCSHYLAIVRGGRSARAPPRSTVTTRATSQVLSPHRGTLTLSILCPGSDLPHLTGVSDPAPPHRWLLISLKPKIPASSMPSTCLQVTPLHCRHPASSSCLNLADLLLPGLCEGSTVARYASNIFPTPSSRPLALPAQQAQRRHTAIDPPAA